MSVFRGSPWQIGHGQVGFGLGGLFRSVARAVMPLVKSGAKSLGKIGMKSGANFVGDVLAGKNVKEASKARVQEAANKAKKRVDRQKLTFKQEVEDVEQNRLEKQLKRERHPNLLSETSRPRNGKHLLKTYLVKHEFCTPQLARMHQK